MIMEDQKEPIETEAQAISERDEYLEGWKRAKADLANYKREEAQRLTATIAGANAALVGELIPVLDSFDAALVSIPSDNSARSGVEILRAQLEDILKRAGLEVIAVKPGEVFNPAFHEAVTEIPSGAPPGSIAAELSRGYRFGGRVVRASRVALSKGPDESSTIN